MIKILSLCLAASVVTTALCAPEPSPAPIQVMILGTYHFGNPGQDLHNMKVESVLTAERQADLEDLAERLAKFQPTKIAVEAISERPDFAFAKFAEFTPEQLQTNPNERAQIAFRLAFRLGQKQVYGIDEQSEKIDYFPFDKVQAYAQAHGQTALLDGMHAKVEQIMKTMETAQKTEPVRLMLAEMNEPKRVRADHGDFYYALLSLGDEKEQPGAELNAAWYQRNAKIFAKLTRVARPGDRVLVIFGAGHGYWLRQLVAHTPGYTLVEPGSYLR